MVAGDLYVAELPGTPDSRVTALASMAQQAGDDPHRGSGNGSISPRRPALPREPGIAHPAVGRPGRTFAIIEIAVRRSYRRRGVARGRMRS